MFRIDQPFSKNRVAVIVFDHASIEVVYLPQRKSTSSVQQMESPNGERIGIHTQAYPFGIDTARDFVFRAMRREDGKVLNPCFYQKVTDPSWFTWNYGGNKHEIVSDPGVKDIEQCELMPTVFFKDHTLYPEVEILDFELNVITAYHHLLRQQKYTRFPNDHEDLIKIGDLKRKIRAEGRFDAVPT